MIHGKVTGGEEVVLAIKSLHGRIHTELLVTVTALAHSLETLIKRKLSGSVLNVLSGLLRSSIHTEIEEGENHIRARVGTSLAEVPYARIHEYGGIITARNAPYLVFQTYDGAWHSVKSVTMPERSYLRSSLADMKPTIEGQIHLALKRAARASKLPTK